MSSRETTLSKVYYEVRPAGPRLDVPWRTSLNAKRLTEALAADLISSGIDPAAIREEATAGSTRYRLRSYRWDLAIIGGGIPRVAIEWARVRYPSDINARLDEVLSTAIDLRAPFEESGASEYRPALAVLIIIDGGLARKRRLEMFVDRLRKMAHDGLLACACVLRFDEETKSLVEVSEDLSFAQFASVIVSRTSTSVTTHATEPDSAFTLGQLLSVGNAARVATGLASTAVGLSAVEAAVIASRRQVVSDLQSLAATNGSTETDMHKAIASNYWIFGGQYTGIAPRRNLTLLDQHDYPLLCADGSLQVVELKGPDCTLIRKHRNHYIVSDEVHEATSQCLNYLRALDEEGSSTETTLRRELSQEIDFRRARGTVVIGHPDRGKNSKMPTTQITQTIRSYNAHLSRIQVITYSELLESADRALRFERLAGDAAEPGA
jgi:hypothetical protein